MNEIISVIVPVYNTPVVLLRNCIHSLISQNFPFLEIIIVDDGSKEDVANECNAFSNEYENIRVIHKVNGGLASARNLGVELSKGDWLVFLDSDDFFEKNTFNELSVFLKKYPTIDFLTFGYVHDFGNRIANCTFNFLNEKIFTECDRELLFIESLKVPSLYSSSCWKIYKRSFLIQNCLFHNEELRQGSEDLEFMLRVINASNQSLHINKRYYHYVLNCESITNSFNEDNSYRVLRCFEKMEDVIGGLNSNIQDRFYCRSWMAICASIVSGFMNPNNSLSLSEKISKTKKFFDDEFCIKTMNKLNFSSLPFSRKAFFVMKKCHLYILMYLVAVFRNHQKNR